MTSYRQQVLEQHQLQEAATKRQMWLEEQRQKQQALDEERLKQQQQSQISLEVTAAQGSPPPSASASRSSSPSAWRFSSLTQPLSEWKERHKVQQKQRVREQTRQQFLATLEKYHQHLEQQISQPATKESNSGLDKKQVTDAKPASAVSAADDNEQDVFYRRLSQLMHSNSFSARSRSMSPQLTLTRSLSANNLTDSSTSRQPLSRPVETSIRSSDMNLADASQPTTDTTIPSTIEKSSSASTVPSPSRPSPTPEIARVRANSSPMRFLQSWRKSSTTTPNPVTSPTWTTQRNVDMEDKETAADHNLAVNAEDSVPSRFHDLLAAKFSRVADSNRPSKPSRRLLFATTDVTEAVDVCSPTKPFLPSSLVSQEIKLSPELPKMQQIDVGENNNSNRKTVEDMWRLASWQYSRQSQVNDADAVESPEVGEEKTSDEESEGDQGERPISESDNDEVEGSPTHSFSGWLSPQHKKLWEDEWFAVLGSKHDTEKVKHPAWLRLASGSLPAIASPTDVL